MHGAAFHVYPQRSETEKPLATSHDDSSRVKPRAASFCCIVLIVDSSDATLPGIKVSFGMQVSFGIRD